MNIIHLGFSDNEENNGYVYQLFKNANTDREILDVIVSVLKKKMLYNHDDFYYMEECKGIMIKNMCILWWDGINKKYIFSFSSCTDILGGAVLINYLHSCGIHNIEIRENFYRSQFESNDQGESTIYFGKNANLKYSKELFKKYKEEIMRDFFQDQFLLLSGNDGTVH